MANKEQRNIDKLLTGLLGMAFIEYWVRHPKEFIDIEKRLIMATRHDVYWSTHGCDRTKGHANPCRCFCGTTLPTGHKYVFGDNKETAVFDPHEKVEEE